MSNEFLFPVARALLGTTGVMKELEGIVSALRVLNHSCASELCMHLVLHGHVVSRHVSCNVSITMSYFDMKLDRI